jgi:hypothetical protein
MNLPGRLRMTTLGDLLGTLHRAGASGTLELTEDSGRTHRVTLSLGLVVAVEIDGAALTLAEVLKREGTVDDELLRRSVLRAMTSRRLHGEVLVQDFRVGRERVDDALRRQLTARLDQLDKLKDARIVFRVAVRPPRGAMTGAPLPAERFLPGRRRARERTGKTPKPSPASFPSPADATRTYAFEVLGISRVADEAEIRRAYRRLARALHPDLHPQASEEQRRELAREFQVVTEAYRSLVA